MKNKLLTLFLALAASVAPLFAQSTPNDNTANGIGKFSVSATQKVTFSPGNLQFNAAQGTHQCADGTTQQGTWRFAEHQWDIVGMGYGKINLVNYCLSGGTVENSDNQLIGSTYNGWIDLFGWGTSGWNSGAIVYQPYSNSKYSEYYLGNGYGFSFANHYTNADWGVYNQIGVDPPQMWRTLSSDEWTYLFYGRTNAEKLFGFGTVNGIQGIIILPDCWETPLGITFNASTDNGLFWQSSGVYYNSRGNNYSHNTYTSEQWENFMETNGAVFIPAAGERVESTIYTTGSNGWYWASTQKYGTNSSADVVMFNSSNLHLRYNEPYSTGCSVRLVRRLQSASETFTITFLNYDGSELQSSEVEAGTMPQYNGNAPTKPADAQYTYTFAGWDKELAAVTGDATYTATYDETINLPEGALPGEFAVSTTQKVRFSKGNLQCKATDYYNWTWQFASQQYEVMLEENHWNTSGVHILDLFGWGTTGYNNKYPTMFSTLTHEYGPDPATDIAGTRYEWGPYMSITNGGHAPGIWRTMTADEWNYILYTRPNADTRKGRAIVNGINGYVLLPDIWNCPAGFSINTDYSAFNDNVFSSKDWEVLEQAGAVFIPCGGERYERALLNASISAFYWTSSYYGEVDSYRNASTIDFSKNGAVTYCRLERGRAVRLVQNSSTYTIALYTIATSATNGKVLGGGQYELNAIVSLTAIPDNGYSFIQWSDGNTDNPRDVIVTGDATYTAVFEKKELPSDITLQENESSDYYTQFAQDYNGQRVNTATLNRQFTQGKWATLCLPFNVNKAMMMSLGLYNRVFAFRYAQQLDDETIQVFFTPAQSIEAGKGYIVNPNAKLAAKTSFVFPNVTINTDSDNGDITTLTGYNDGTNRGNLFLVGTLRTGVLQGTTTGNTYLGLKDNQLYYPNTTSGTSIRAYRGFFRSDAPVNASRVRIIAEGEPVSELEVTVDEQGRMDNGQLQNNATPARKYLRNGILYIERNGITYTAQGQRID